MRTKRSRLGERLPIISVSTYKFYNCSEVSVGISVTGPGTLSGTSVRAADTAILNFDDLRLSEAGTYKIVANIYRSGTKIRSIDVVNAFEIFKFVAAVRPATASSSLLYPDEKAEFLVDTYSQSIVGCEGGCPVSGTLRVKNSTLPPVEVYATSFSASPQTAANTVAVTIPASVKTPSDYYHVSANITFSPSGRSSTTVTAESSFVVVPRSGAATDPFFALDGNGRDDPMLFAFNKIGLGRLAGFVWGYAGRDYAAAINGIYAGARSPGSEEIKNTLDAIEASGAFSSSYWDPEPFRGKGIPVIANIMLGSPSQAAYLPGALSHLGVPEGADYPDEYYSKFAAWVEGQAKFFKSRDIHTYRLSEELDGTLTQFFTKEQKDRETLRFARQTTYASQVIRNIDSDAKVYSFGFCCNYKPSSITQLNMFELGDDLLKQRVKKLLNDGTFSQTEYESVSGMLQYLAPDIYDPYYTLSDNIRSAYAKGPEVWPPHLMPTPPRAPIH